MQTRNPLLLLYQHTWFRLPVPRQLTPEFSNDELGIHIGLQCSATDMRNILGGICKDENKI